jgi:hypothetical protein
LVPSRRLPKTRHHPAYLSWTTSGSERCPDSVRLISRQVAAASSRRVAAGQARRRRPALPPKTKMRRRDPATGRTRG